MENKEKMFFAIFCITILFLFLLPVFVMQSEKEQKNGLFADRIFAEALSDQESQREMAWDIECLYPLQKKSMAVMGKFVRLFVVTILFINLFHLNCVLFLQGKGRVFACFKACVFYPAQFLCEWFIQQKGDGKKRIPCLNN